ncbi:MAG: hypothetical protein ACOYUZ_06600 [Patescibacteria group bacterium]
MNAHFKTCAFPGCQNLVASSRDSVYCYALHICLIGTGDVNGWQEKFAKGVRFWSHKALSFWTPNIGEPEDDEVVFDEMHAEICSDYVVYYLFDPEYEDGRFNYEHVEYAAIASLKKYPKRTIVAFATIGLPSKSHGKNLKKYYDWLSRFPGSHLCKGIYSAESELEELIRREH